MKIVRRSRCNLKGKWSHVSPCYRHYIVLMLQGAFDQKKWRIYQHEPVPVEKLRRYDHIGYASFIFHRQEKETFRRTGSLPDDYPTCHTYSKAVAQLPNINGAGYSQLI